MTLDQVPKICAASARLHGRASLRSHVFSKLLWGGKVVGLKIDLPRANAAVVKNLVELAYRIKAPKKPNRGK